MYHENYTPEPDGHQSLMQKVGLTVAGCSALVGGLLLSPSSESPTMVVCLFFLAGLAGLHIYFRNAGKWAWEG